MNCFESHIVTPGPYRATKLWNEVTKLFRAGMPLKKHRHNLRSYGNCFTATAAVDWLHELLRNNSNFGPEVTRQQTVQLLKKFLKNHVIEDVKGKWGSEELEDNSQLYRFPSTSPVKPIPHVSDHMRKNSLTKERDRLFKFRNSKKISKESQENVDPLTQGEPTASSPEAVHRRELTDDDILDIWRNITLTHLQKTLGLTSLDDVLNPFEVNARHIIYNMTNVNKHGVVTLEDKSDDLPHWALSAMKCLANWPKYDLNQPSYPGFERDVFKTVSDYFVNLPEPLLTYEYYELFVNILVLCGYIVVPKNRNGKRKNSDDCNHPQPPKTPHLSSANAFKSTECLLLSLIRKEAFDETESPMREVFSSKAALASPVPATDRVGKVRERGDSQGSATTCQDLLHTKGRGTHATRLRPRSCSVEGTADYSTDSCSQPRFKSVENLTLCRSVSSSSSIGPSCLKAERQLFASTSTLYCGTRCGKDNADVHYPRATANSGTLFVPEVPPAVEANRSSSRCFSSLVHSVGHRAMCASCSSINAPVAEITMKPNCSSGASLRRPGVVKLVSCAVEVKAGPGLSRRCHSTADLSNKPADCLPPVSTFARHPSPDQSVLQPQLERVATEALQLCTLLLPPASRRKLQLLMRMISRMSQNVDMPRLHSAIGTRTLMVHTFSRCVLRCEEEVDLDELLATRLVSFLMDHHQEILHVPVYLQNAVQDHIAYLRKVQVTYPAPGAGMALPAYSFCRQISAQEFEEQKLSISHAAIADLLESLIKDKTMSLKEKKKKLKQFQKEYPEIYSRRFPNTESEAQLFMDKPKIKPPMLMSIKKTKAFSVWN